MKGRTSRKFVVSSPYKRLVKTLRYNQPGYTARCLMKTPSIREATLAEFLKVCGNQHDQLSKSTLTLCLFSL